MKKIALIALGVLAIALPSFAIQQLDLDLSPRLHAFTSGVLVGPLDLQTSDTKVNANRITRSLGGSITFDFASTTITCEDSTAITVTGARTGDACFVGPPTTISGAGTGLHSTFSCYVSASNAVKVRHCAAGTADNPASATFNVRVFSAQ